MTDEAATPAQLGQEWVSRVTGADAPDDDGVIEPEVYEEVLAHWAAAVAEHPDYRVLRRFRPERDLPVPPAAGQWDLASLHRGAFVDVETTGLEATDKIIELAVVPFWYNGRGDIMWVEPAYEQLEHPGRPIPQEITELTGISDESVVNQAIDDDAVMAHVGGAELLVAHNAEFDRPFFERRFPQLVGKPWGCSYRDIAWKAAGYPHATVDDLLRETRHQFSDHHRAAMDAYAALHVLAATAARCGDPEDTPIDGRTWLAQLLDAANAPTIRFIAWGAPFRVKDALKARGYRWDATKRVWWRDHRGSSADAEVEHRILKALAPDYSTAMFTARDRYSERMRND